MNIYNKEEKKVEYLELIFDLIFVYMVSRDNALLASIHDGFVEPSTFLMYTFCTLSIIQIWSFTTFYINMFGRNGLRDHIFLLSNMYLMYFIGEGIQMNAVSYITEYHIAWGLILINVGAQYLIELRNHRKDVWNRGVIVRMAQTLFIEAAMVLIAAFLPALPSTVLSFAAIFVGILLTALGRATSIGGQVDFMHLSERAMLYVVFTFGEMVIAIAGYFADGGHVTALEIYYSLMTFLIAVGLFLSYEIVYNYLVYREGHFSGLVYMLYHIFLVYALGNVTVAFEFMREEEIDLLPKILMLTISLSAYYLFLFLLSGHFKLRCHFDLRFVIKMSAITAAFILVMVLLRENMALGILVSVLYSFTVFLILFRMKGVQEQRVRERCG